MALFTAARQLNNMVSMQCHYYKIRKLPVVTQFI